MIKKEIVFKSKFDEHIAFSFFLSFGAFIWIIYNLLN